MQRFPPGARKRNLAQTLIRHGLIDEAATLRLVDSIVSKTGVFMGTYEPAGEVVTGSF